MGVREFKKNLEDVQAFIDYHRRAPDSGSNNMAEAALGRFMFQTETCANNHTLNSRMCEMLEQCPYWCCVAEKDAAGGFFPRGIINQISNQPQNGQNIKHYAPPDIGYYIPTKMLNHFVEQLCAGVASTESLAVELLRLDNTYTYVIRQAVVEAKLKQLDETYKECVMPGNSIFSHEETKDAVIRALSDRFGRKAYVDDSIAHCKLGEADYARFVADVVKNFASIFVVGDDFKERLTALIAYLETH